MAPGQYSANPAQHTLQPIVTGATVIAMKYAGGVIMAADTLASYGSQARYKNVCRLKSVGKYTLLGASGEFSDFQYIGDLLDDLDTEDWLHEDGCAMGPHEYSSYIGRVMYNRRSKMNPLYNQFVVVGKKQGEEPKLMFVDHQGTSYEDDHCATGFGMHMAKPILRNEWRPDITLAEARALIVKCLQICFYRDCNAYNKIQMGICDGETVTIEEPITMDHKWDHSLWLKKTHETQTNFTADTW